MELGHNNTASLADACETTYYTSYPLRVGNTFHLVRCHQGS